MTIVAVMGAPREGTDFPRDAVFGECRDCRAELGWSRQCPANLPALCVSCVAAVALKFPTVRVMLPSGQRTILAVQASAGTLQ